MKTTKRDLARAYDSLSNALADFGQIRASVDNYRPGEADQALTAGADRVRARGAALIAASKNASARCGEDLLDLCENLIDKSTTVLIKYSEKQRRTQRTMRRAVMKDSVELIQTWHPGGGRGNLSQSFVDGDHYLFAVRLSGGNWDIQTVIAKCDSENCLEFDTPTGDVWDAWSWLDVEWFCPCDDIHLPE